MNKLKKKIAEYIYNYENPNRIAFSTKYSYLKNTIIFLRYLIRNIQNVLNFNIKYKKGIFFNCIVARHQSLLKRKLGNSSMKLQEQKILNIEQAIKKLNNVIIEPNKVFSFWQIVGKPTYKKGYVNGMLLSNGQVVEGVGGGLCQLSNFLYWIFLHAPIETIERYHHSMDVFPDENRTLPFGSGATILYNFIDLQVKNISRYPLQLKLWLTDKHLKGQILAPERIPQKFHIFEKNHFFIKKGKKYFRYNEIYRAMKIEGRTRKIEKMITNFAPVLYKTTNDYFQKHNFKVLDFTNSSPIC